MAVSGPGVSSIEGSSRGGGDEQQRGTSNERPVRTLSGRSASPAKRRAADMESGGGGQRRASGASAEIMAASVDVQMDETTSTGPGAEAQDSATEIALTGISTPATRVGSDQPPPYTAKDSASQKEKDYTTAEIDEQVARVRRIGQKPLEEGDRGVCISKTWIARVLARTSDGLNSKEYPQEAREGPVGPLDNSDIVPNGAFQEPLLHDAYGKQFIPLKVGLEIESDFLVVPFDAYCEIVANFGNTLGQRHPITRYAHDTAEEGAVTTNIQYELHPPIITVRKVPQQIGSESQQVKHKTSLGALKAKHQGTAKYGQQSPDDVLRLVSSKAEKFQDFLRRAKEAAAIPVSRKVKVWRLVDASTIAIDKPNNTQSGVLSPPPSPTQSGVPSLIIPPELFKKMEVGKELEHVDFQDQTNNSNYNGKSNMHTAGFFEDKTMLLEEQIGGPAGGEFQSDLKKGMHKFGSSLTASKPASATTSGRTSPAPGGVLARGRTRRDGRARGATGLMNLGNTCYMNSALQCIRSVEELAVYFLSKKYKKEINNDNPLGYRGAVANAYAGVLSGIYESSNSSAFSPNEFKKTLGKHQPLFSGYGQQDSQEFLSFLVDALHEDLNRIKTKPYIENPDSEDSKVHDPAYIAKLGETYRNNHKQRNDSIAMDLFSGHYKNKMECPECNKVSVTFDPYSLVTVQLPMEITWQHPITYIPLRSKPVLHKVEIDKNASLKTLKDVLAKKHPGADASRMWMIESYAHKVFKVFDDQSVISEANIQPNDHIFVHELDQVPKNGAKKTYDYLGKANELPREGMDAEQADVFTVPVLSRTKANGSSHSLSDFPLYITVTREEAKDYDIILKKVIIAVANTTSRPILKEFDESRGPFIADSDRAGSEDAAGVSDHSAPSEDGYVDVSIEKATQDAVMADGGESDNMLQANDTFVPPNFMDSQYYLSPALRTHLFELKYYQASHGMQCSMGMTGPAEINIHDMYERVKRPSRRSSLQSSDSNESTLSAASGDRGNGEEDDGEDEDEGEGDGIDEEPDIVLGDQPSSEPKVNSGDVSHEDAILMEPSEVPSTFKKNRRKNNKKRRGKKGRGGNQNGFMTYSNKDRRSGQHRPLYGAKRPSGRSDSPYYIELGEAIILDWRPEAEDSLFGGDPMVADDLRGHRYCAENGRDAPLFPDPEQDAKRSKREQRKKQGVTLDDCFDVTSQPEILSEDNAWYCNRCKELRRATKTLEIWTLPDILVVHLKRFGGNRSFRDKVDIKVDYPIEGLDMTERIGSKEEGKEYIYDLFAVDNHYGGLGGGHYTAMAKNFNDGEWYNYNDSSVSSINKSDGVLSAAAYLLFYRRRSNQPLGPQALQDLVLEYRNPATFDDADDEESGEGRPGEAQFGSSSSGALVGAGLGAKSSRRALVGNGGAGVGRQATQKTKTIDDEYTHDNVGRSAGPFAEPTWGFDSLDGQSGSDALLEHIERDDDINSMAGEADRDSAIGDDPPPYSGHPNFIHVTHNDVEQTDDSAADITLEDADGNDLYS